MKKFALAACVTFAIVFVGYGFGAFWTWNADPGAWSADMRGGIAMFGLLIAPVLIAGVAMDWDR